MAPETATQDLETRTKTARLRVQTQSRLSKRPLNFEKGSATAYFPCNGIVRDAAIECCGESTPFTKGNKVRVILPAKVNCTGCNTPYIMEQHNTAQVKIYGRE